VAYGRYGTSNSNELERTLAELEGGDAALVSASGLSAIWTVLGAFVGNGDHVLMVDCAYSPARRICLEELSRFGVSTTFFDPAIGAAIANLIQPNTKLIYLESPGFLTMEVVDISSITQAARKRGVVVVCDNTWATPLHLKPFEHGIDISLHSATKYIGGHSDLLLGALIFKAQHREHIWRYSRNVGAVAAPDVCYLAQRGLRTMGLRLKQHEASALKVAEWLKGLDIVETVLHPALPDDPGHALWKRYYTGSCGLFSFVLRKSYAREQLAKMLDNMRLFSMGFSWGGFESLIIPFDPTPNRAVAKWPYKGQAFRVHIGLEHVDDLIEDLEQGFKRLGLT
jgi:cystathionine beta-lyase